ncbi:hypothetical protein [Jannaschia aquimarina]|uniref:Uncharacterized protein n=1 Tax=Jannaschia aquimarina TaxID=935700 RepID=A0A0D1EK57_9RHOB|nr:hypothetical protein [Jannaschia aquimarina]KIT17954.1 hypothetical protein jaqu_03110 [Jannaschia aquimarina]SNT08141.1 hypothetical protein SAMN05421775_105162 [Jannaschia aquimarina]
MNAPDYTPYYRADLEAQTARAREKVEASTARAAEMAEGMPPAGEENPNVRLWNLGGHYAFLFCLWFVFLAPIVLILTHWD